MRRSHFQITLLAALLIAPIAGINAQDDAYRDASNKGEQQLAPGSQPSRIGVVPRPVPPQPAPVVYRPSHLQPQIWTDRGSYYLGDPLQIYFRSDADAYVYVFNTDAAGRQTQIFPNYYDGLNKVRAGQTYVLPNGRYDLRVEPPAGTETLTILAVEEDYPDVRAHYHGYSQAAPFAQGFKSPEALVREFESRASAPAAMQAPAPDHARSDWRYEVDRYNNGGEKPISAQAPNDPNRQIAVRPRPVPEPVTPIYPAPAPVYRYGIKTIRIQTHDPYPVRPPVVRPVRDGWLHIKSTPSRASLYIDGEFCGTTPYRSRIAPGRHTIELRKSGYEPLITKVHIDPGHSESRTLHLRREYRYDYDIHFGYHGDDWSIEYNRRE